MNADDEDMAPLWDVFDLPPIGEMNNVDPDGDMMPTPEGQVRCYFNGELMRSLLDSEFSIGFDNEPGEPMALVFEAPAAMWPDEEPPEPSLRTISSETEIPIGEQREPSPHKRTFVPADDVTWDFEITVETTPYNTDR